MSSLLEELNEEDRKSIISIVDRNKQIEEDFLQVISIIINHRNGNGNDNVDTQRDTKKLKQFEERIPLIEFKNLSFLSPLRKKQSLIICQNYIQLKSGSVDHELEIQKIKCWAILPGPEKPDQMNTVLIFGEIEETPQIVFNLSLNDDLNFSASENFEIKKEENENGSTFFRRTLTQTLQKQPMTYSPKVFQGTKGKQFLTCHLKAKEGALYFLQDGIIFGMKKPVLFLKRKNIKTATTTGFTSRYFDFEIETTKEKLIFSMIPKDEHHFVLEYIRKYLSEDNIDNINDIQNLNENNSDGNEKNQNENKLIDNQKMKEKGKLTVNEEEDDDSEDEDYNPTEESSSEESYVSDYSNFDEEEEEGEDAFHEESGNEIEDQNLYE